MSLKATQEDPWRRYFATHHVGEIVPGTVTKLVPFGAFVLIGPGIEGLVHLAELSTHEVAAPAEVVREGDDVLVMLIDEVDFARRHINLFIRRATEASAHDPTAASFNTTQ
ncbi:S1 RNA-binding domain-containing protein [Kitasatospora aureofaciens]|uniref:S1 RNA-binding domain-containing protein n=1 Tax=Kitasatospora aureofaciens TaxID=1894 RepID=UPI0038194CFA